MKTIKIDFSPEVSTDTLLMPVYDHEQKCVGGILYEEEKPDKQKLIPVSEVIRLVRDYKKLLDFCQREFPPFEIVKITCTRITLGASVIAYELNGDGYNHHIVSRAQYLEIFGD